MSHPLYAVGAAMFEIVGMVPSANDYQSEAQWPDAQVFGTEPFYQPTGMGQRVLALRAGCRPHVMDGLTAYTALKRHHERQDVVPYIRMGVNLVGEVTGSVFVRRVGHLEEHFAWDGRGYRHGFDFELVLVGRNGTP
ncbi:phage tail protein [Xanthobacter sp.]|uniref:phage tail protein n=1 Tax=Xanthobacter sp. TaxID=35809 RepID=UPI0025EF7CC3|nr:phage tail protein [Xanthobacter sp.]